jgi:hypothetical protein
MTHTEAILAIIKDHCYGRHGRSHPQCPVCVQQRPKGPEWVRRMHEQGLPAKDHTSVDRRATVSA